MHNRQVPYLSVDAFFSGLSLKCQITKEKAVTVYRSNLVPCNLTLSLWLHYLFSARGHPWASRSLCPWGGGRGRGPRTSSSLHWRCNCTFPSFSLPHTSFSPLPSIHPLHPLGRVVARLGFLGKRILTFKTFFFPTWTSVDWSCLGWCRSTGRKTEKVDEDCDISGTLWFLFFSFFFF